MRKLSLMFHAGLIILSCAIGSAAIAPDRGFMVYGAGIIAWSIVRYLEEIR